MSGWAQGCHLLGLQLGLVQGPGCTWCWRLLQLWFALGQLGCPCPCPGADLCPHRRLKTVNLVIRSTQGAEDLVRKYEEQLKDVQTVPADLKELEASKAELKVRVGLVPAL